MRVETILFDLDGTLIDSLEGIERSVQAAIQSVLGNVATPPLRTLIGPPLPHMLRKALGHLPATTVEASLESIDFEFRNNYDSNGWRMSVPFDDIFSTLRELAIRRIRCFVVTNKRHQAAMRILNHLAISEWLDDVICRDSLGEPFESKGAAVEYLLARHHIDRATTIFVGDTSDDAKAAEANELRFVFAAYGYGAASEVVGRSDDRIDALRELPTVIDRLSIETGIEFLTAEGRSLSPVHP